MVKITIDLDTDSAITLKENCPNCNDAKYVIEHEGRALVVCGCELVLYNILHDAMSGRAVYVKPKIRLKKVQTSKIEIKD